MVLSFFFTALNKFSLSLRKEQNDLVFPYQYSYTNFTDIDHRIKMYVWDQLTPDNADITAFLRVSVIFKNLPSQFVNT